MSTEAQLLGDSLRRQVERSRAFAAEQRLDLVEDYHDLGVSAFRGKNVDEGKLGLFLNAVKAGKVPRDSYLLVESLDRLSRQQVSKSLRIFLGIIDAGVNIVTLNDGHVYSENCDTTELILSIMVLGRANEESETKRDRVAKAWANKRANAKTRPLTAMAPAWLKLSADRKRFEKNPERAEIVRSIFEDSAKGIGNYVIVKRLNEKRIPPFGPARKTKQGMRGWHTCSIGKILSNRAVLGEFQPHRWVNGRRVPEGDPIRNYFPPIIEEELFYRAQQGREQRLDRYRGKGHGGRKGNNVSNLFSSIARCAYCSSPIYFENKSRGAYLFCNAARRGLECCNIATGWRYDEFEASFLTFVSELDLASILNSASQERARMKLDNEIASLRGKVAAIEQQRDAAFDLIGKTTTSSDYVSKKLDELTQHLAVTNEMLQKKEREISALSSEVAAFYKSKELPEVIAKLQNGGDQTYKLRAQIASKLKSLITSLFVAPVGSAPLVAKAKTFIEKHGDDVDDLITFMAKIDPDEGRFFAVTFKDGSTRSVQPSPDDPWDYVQQTGQLDDMSFEDSTLPGAIEEFHRLIDETA
jgi:DNA invertase Pin-like site-specific DNA recombinase